jgi:DNA replication protein DnaC
MQRHEMIEAMRALGLKGMAGAFDEAVTTGLQRKRTTNEILTDLLRAEAAHRHAASIRYRMTAAKLPVIKDLDAFVFEGTPINEGLVRSLHAGSFLPGRRNIVLIGGTGTGKTHLATAITASVVRVGARGRYFNTVDLVTRPQCIIGTRIYGRQSCAARNGYFRSLSTPSSAHSHAKS